MNVSDRPLVFACGALANDLRFVLRGNAVERGGEKTSEPLAEVHYLPANLHNRPEKIVPELRPLIDAAIAAGRKVFVGYADCGTGGGLDRMLAEYPGVTRLPGDHCYAFFTGISQFEQLHQEELGTFFLTDFLAKHFDALIWSGLGLDRSPALVSMYFGNYRRVVLLLQTPGGTPEAAEIERRGRAAAERLNLEFELVETGREHFAAPILEFADALGPKKLLSGKVA